jgi:hypothetical protein
MTFRLVEEKYDELLEKARISVRRRITSRVEALLPKTYDLFRVVLDNTPDDTFVEGVPKIGARSTKSNDKNIVIALAKYVGTDVRDVGWIQRNGMCLENIVPNPSTRPHAGRGAFAQFPIQKDAIIVPAPTLQILHKGTLDLYDGDDRYGKQLLLNYCFGHDESTILLCPNTNAILINHCSERGSTKTATNDDDDDDGHSCGNHGPAPNAMYRWGTSWDPLTAVWMNMTIDEMLSDTGRGISLEIVATRNIEPGEEVCY